MGKYKINYIYDKGNDINNIFINVLKKELKNYVSMICKKEESETSSFVQFFQEGEKIVRKDK